MTAPEPTPTVEHIDAVTISEAEDAVRAARAEIHTHSEVAP